MRTRIYFLLIIISALNNVSAKKTSITFRSNSDIYIRVNKPIDGAFNFYVISDKLELKANLSINYGLEVHDFCSVRCELSNGNSFDILLLEGDSIEIDNMNNRILFKGDNAAGNQYLVDNYCTKGLGFYLEKVEQVFKRHITDRIDFDGFDKDFQDSIQSPFLNDVRQLERDNKITSRFATVMSQNLQNAYSSMLFFMYEKTLKGKEFGYKPSSSDSLAIMTRIDELYQRSLKVSNPLAYYYQFPYEGYYPLKYNTLDKTVKEKLLGSYDEDAFNYYIRLLFAPDNIQPILLGETCVSQLQNLDNNFDSSKMLKYLSDKFPESGYIPIIKELIQKQNLIHSNQTTEQNDAQPIFMDGKNIRSIKELINASPIKGKRVYIDLWATFCMPCKMQFQYNKELHKLINQYKNLVPVYISIDEDKNEINWRNQIAYYKLSGYQLRASKALYNDIQQHIYKNGDFLVPRYLLLDTDGSILNDNLPRPQAIDKLKEAFDKALIKK